MPNDIPKRQNEETFQNLLAAYSQAYDNVAFFGKIQTCLVVLTAVAVPLLNWKFEEFRPWGAGLSVVVTAIVLWIELSIKRNQKLGATIQELFDTELFRLRWNQIRVGEKPPEERIIRLHRKFYKNNSQNAERIQRLRDWYPPSAGKLPIELGRLVCQRASMAWDTDLRKLYCSVHTIAILCIVVLGIIWGLYQQLSFSDFLKLIAAPLLPVMLKLTRDLRKQKDSAAASERARQALTGTWEQAMEEKLSVEVLETDSRNLQDELFDRRSNASHIPSWFYLLKRDDFEAGMIGSAEKMVDEAAARSHTASLG